jgi:hypothetical protein
MDIKKRMFCAIALSALVLTGNAQEGKQWFNNFKLSGYALTQYQYSSQANSKSNSFNLRMLRMSLEGRIAQDFYWKTQIQFNGNTSTLGNSPRVVDLFVEWQKYKFAYIKVGQFKRAFTFENPMNPIDQGFMAYGQNVLKLAGFNDRNGSHASNGRDIGIQLQGDLFKNANNRYLFHYQVGVYNGQGINVKDVDQQKDVIGGVWFMPVKGMRLGWFGWTGSYARKGTWQTVDANGNTVDHSGTRSLQQRRYAVSAEYKANDWTLRSEYIHSTGYAFKTTYQKESDAKDCNLSSNGDKAEGVYALVIAPVVKKKLYAKARYDYYTPNGSGAKARNAYEAGFNYLFSKNIQLNAEYAHIIDRSLQKENYNMIDVELDFRF